jgi:DNA-binding XRE family transcriptional regulator
MTIPTNVQIIEQGGKPAFVVIPYDEYLRTFSPIVSPAIPDGDLIPHEVVMMTLRLGMSQARAWREYLGLTQEVVAAKIGISQSALAQIEASSKPRKATRQKLAEALGVNLEQLI